MLETFLTGLKTLAMAAVMTSLGIYTGAALIALIAALSRIAYTNEQVSITLFGRFFFMSLSITMIMVHVGKLSGWDNDSVIIVSGVTAFLCREVLEFIIGSKNIIFKRLTSTFK